MKGWYTCFKCGKKVRHSGQAMIRHDLFDCKKK